MPVLDELSDNATRLPQGPQKNETQNPYSRKYKIATKKKNRHFSPIPGKNPAARGFIKACLKAMGLPTMPSAPCQLRSTSASDIVYEVQQAASTTILPSKLKLP